MDSEALSLTTERLWQREMGLEEGDTIRLFDMEFEYYDEDYGYDI